MKKSRVVIFAALAAVAVAVFFAFSRSSGSERSPGRLLVFASVVTGDVVATVSASGTIEPVELVDVGSQVSGKIVSFGLDSNGDEVDYCSEVTNGMVLARIDDVTYLADLEVARAQQVAAAAAVSSAAASLAKARVDAARAARDFERLSQSDYDAYQAEAESAEAQVGVAEAASEQAAAQVVQAQANVEKAERNLGYCTIVSPVDGVVIDRRVNLGQTVVSSMSVSSLFLVAKDLRHVRIWASVNEADVGAVRAGQGVSFTVDAFPGRVFRGVVRRVRLNATLSSNVVTYTVEIDVDNPDLVLLPYLTASVEFETEAVRGALVVPSRALRWNPAVAGVSPDGMAGKAVWVDCGADASPRRVPVRVLLDNGTSAAIEALEGGALSIGSRVVEREEAFVGSSSKAGTGGNSAVSGGSNNPFLSKMPKPPRGGRPH